MRIPDSEGVQPGHHSTPPHRESSCLPSLGLWCGLTAFLDGVPGTPTLWDQQMVFLQSLAHVLEVSPRADTGCDYLPVQAGRALVLSGISPWRACCSSAGFCPVQVPPCELSTSLLVCGLKVSLGWVREREGFLVSNAGLGFLRSVAIALEGHCLKSLPGCAGTLSCPQCHTEPVEAEGWHGPAAVNHGGLGGGHRCPGLLQALRGSSGLPI